MELPKFWFKVSSYSVAFVLVFSLAFVSFGQTVFAATQVFVPIDAAGNYDAVHIGPLLYTNTAELCGTHTLIGTYPSGTIGTLHGPYTCSDAHNNTLAGSVYSAYNNMNTYWYNNVGGGPGGPAAGNYYFRVTPNGSSDVRFAAFTRAANGDWSSGALVPASAISTTTTWGGGTTYTVSGNLVINSGATLNIEAGAMVKFDTATSSSITVDGTLNVLGDRNEPSSWNPVVLTSLKDDNVGNPPDANSDGNSTSPASGDWGGIQVNTGGTANIYGAIVRYADTGIYNDGGSITVASSTVAHNDTYGIYNNSGTTNAYAVDLGYQDYGLYINGGTASITATSTIHDNSSYGIYNATGNTVNAENNYWANSSGPSSTYGSEVSGSVDYTPFITVLHYVRGGCPDSLCGSVENNYLLYNAASSTYSSEVSNAAGTWNAENKVVLSATSTIAAKLFVQNTYADDVAWKGGWDESTGPGGNGLILLNEYYLDADNSNEIENTIVHELGHALGLLHSYTGNVMYHNQTNQTTLGPQDLRDYHYLWP